MKAIQWNSNPAGTEKLSIFLKAASDVILGKENELKLAFVCLLSRGHLLLEDIPGMGKTTFVQVLSHLLGLDMKRVQFTNDLLPSDVIGANIFDPPTGKFKFVPGPIFAQIVLGDELNRASAKSQSAFLQAMEERSVTVEGQTHKLPDPFFIIATQNPQSQVGTNPLPESQLDRFLMRLKLGYPDRVAEQKMLLGGNPRDRLSQLKSIFTQNELLNMQKDIDKVAASRALIEYVQDLLQHSRKDGFGLSPRAGLLLLQASKAIAYVSGREMVLPEDIQFLAPYVWSHRLPPENESYISQLIKAVPVP